MEDKGSILIHEIAHLVGLTSDRETDSLKSAECIRNFLLLCAGKVTKNELFISGEEAKALEKSIKKDDSDDKSDSAKSKKIPTRLGEHLYDPDQPRVPAGSSTGGQWTSDGSNSDSSKDDEENSGDPDASSEDDNEDSENSKGENADDNSETMQKIIKKRITTKTPQKKILKKKTPLKR